VLTRRTLLCAAAASLSTRLAHAAALGIAPRPLRFPEDFGAHPDARTEWWYVTGELKAGQDTYGFQVTFFRSLTGVSRDHPSRFAASEIVFAHAALTDLQHGKLRRDQRVARQGFGIAGAREGDTAVVLREWKLTREGDVNESRYRASVGSDSAGFSLDLDLATRTPPVLQGDAGYSRKSPRPGRASHYYSRPQLETTGMLVLDGKRIPVRGKAWLDHEWSTAYLDEEAVGWDWLGMNLDSGDALTAFRIRRADGSALYAGGSWHDVRGSTRNFAPGELRFTPGRVWISPASRARYPVEWTLDLPSARFTVKALLDNQELDSRGNTGAIYWEGLSEMLDAGGRPIGRGYLEMTGYAGALKM
jgi:predicted secreted hydrolase